DGGRLPEWYDIVWKDWEGQGSDSFKASEAAAAYRRRVSGCWDEEATDIDTVADLFCPLVDERDTQERKRKSATTISPLKTDETVTGQQAAVTQKPAPVKSSQGGKIDANIYSKGVRGSATPKAETEEVMGGKASQKTSLEPDEGKP